MKCPYLNCVSKRMRLAVQPITAIGYTLQPCIAL